MSASAEVPYLSPCEAANELSVTPLTIYRWIKAGRLLASQPGGRHGRLRIPKAAVLAAKRNPVEGDIAAVMGATTIEPLDTSDFFAAALADGIVGLVQLGYVGDAVVLIHLRVKRAHYDANPSPEQLPLGNAVFHRRVVLFERWAEYGEVGVIYSLLGADRAECVAALSGKNV